VPERGKKGNNAGLYHLRGSLLEKPGIHKVERMVTSIGGRHRGRGNRIKRGEGI